MLVLEKVSIGTIGYRDQYKKKKNWYIWHLFNEFFYTDC